MKFMMAVFFLTVAVSPKAFADGIVKILSVGAISINPCQEAKVLADWYSRFGIETKEIGGGYFGQIDTAAGPLIFGIHAKRAAKCLPNVGVVYRVENFEESLAVLQRKGLVPDELEEDPMGKFAYFQDPDGNRVSLWEKK